MLLVWRLASDEKCRKSREGSQITEVAAAITYYVHESWRDGQFIACLHRGDCIHCNEGRGQEVGSTLRRGKWHGPFKSRSKAVAKLASVPGITVRVTCECAESQSALINCIPTREFFLLCDAIVSASTRDQLVVVSAARRDTNLCTTKWHTGSKGFLPAASRGVNDA